jgi:N-acetylmuramate 1-kinase
VSASTRTTSPIDPLDLSAEHSIVLSGLRLDGMRRLAQRLALFVRPGDLLALEGDLGAGKTSFARFLIQALKVEQPWFALNDDDIPSPTFALLQEYQTPRMSVAHFDLYRMRDETELEEIGFDDACRFALVLVEWPERTQITQSGERLCIALAETGDPEARDVGLRGYGRWAARLQRLEWILQFLDQTAWGDADLAYLQGDASQRAYARLRLGKRQAILMDAPRQPDGPPVRDGLPYSRVAHLAEDVRPFVAIAGVLHGAGLSAPEIFAADLERGLVLLEDLGDGVFGTLILGKGPSRQEALWTAALDTLVALRAKAPSFVCPLPSGAIHTLPRLDRPILEIETGLLPAWYWPEAKGRAMPEPEHATYTALWSPLIDRLIADPPGWMLRDYHSPNLIWLPDRDGQARVGVIDFQDALQGPWSHDVMSLLQDARVDVPADLEQRLLDRYCARMAKAQPGFDEADFRTIYAIYGALRSTRLLGLWFRLLRRDGKPQYLQHAPRTWDYMQRNLEHPALADLRAWYGLHFSEALRASVDTKRH